MTLAAVLFAGAAHAACSINIGPASMPDATLNQNYSQLLSASGAIPPFTFLISSGALPPGLKLSVDFRIQGTPTSAGSYSFQISVTDSTGCQARKSFGLKVIDSNTCPTIVIGPTTLPAGVVGMTYNQRITFGGGASPYTLTFGQGSIPPGIGLLGTTLAGTPTIAGVFGFDLRATDSKGCTATKHYDFEILGPSCSADVATVLAPANGTSQDAAKPIVFAWTAVAGAASYDILASTDNGSTYKVVASTSNGTTASATLAAGDYVASVRTTFSAACSTRSATVKFTVSDNSTCANAPPTLIAPKPAAVNTGPSVTFQWSAVPTAKDYRLFTSVNGASFEDVAETSSTTATLIVSTGTIDWYVEARFANCASVRSATARFVVGALQCGTGSVALAAPANGATTSSPTTFAWTGITGASAYRVWLGIDNATPSIIARVTTTSAALQVPSGAAEWFVEAQFDNCPSIFSGHGKFTIARAASCANIATTLLSPLSGDTSSSVTFKWNTVPGAIAYRLWVATTGQAFSDAGLTPLTQLKLDLAPGSYSWYVDSIYGGCPAVSSSTATFRVPDTGSNCSGDAPTIIAPANGAVAASPVTFTWTSVANATEYRVYASVNGGALNLVDDTKDTSLTESVPEGTIVWLVEGTFKGCPATRSGTSRFTVPRAVTCPTDKPQIISPSNGSEVNSPVTLSWSAVTGAVRYVVVARTSSGAQTAIGETALTQIQRDLPAGTIEWSVIALGAGCGPINSDRGKFTVASPAGCDSKRPHPLAPADDSVNIASPVHFAWTKVANAKSYRLFAAIDGDDPTLITTTTTNETTVAMPSGRIRWYVQAVFDTCPTLFSAISDVIIASKPGTCSAPDMPKAHVVAQVLSGTEYNVRWTDVTNASVYELQESISSDFSGATTTSVTGISAPFTHTATTAPVQHFYRVRAVSACSDERSTYSRVVSTRVIPPDTIATRTRGTAEQGVQNPVVQTLTLPGSSTPVAFTATTDKPWLTVTPSSGTIPTTGLTLTVTADPRSIDVGANDGTVRISYPNSNSRIQANGSTSSNIPISISLVTPVVPDTKASPPPDALIIPAVAHAAGANSSQFRSDIRLANVSSQAMRYLINFTPTATDGTQSSTSTTIQVDAGVTVALDDILASFYGTASSGSSTGMLEIRPLTSSSSSSLFSAVPTNLLASIASSRTYNVTSQGTFGQFIPAIPFSQFIGKGSVLSLQQVAQSAAYRTNFGLVEAAGEPASVLLRVFDASGAEIGDVPVSLLASEHLALNGLLSQFGTINDGRVEVEVLSNTGKVSAYASVLDNKTNDPLLVSPVLKSSVASNRYVIPGVAYTNGIADWRTDVRLYNSAGTAVNATVNYYPEGAPTSVQSRTITIAAGETKALDNVLNSLFGISAPSATGSVVVTTAGTSNIIATARTYAVTDVGTIGQFIPAVTPSDAVGAGDRALQLLQLESSDAFRTNIGLAETTGNPATVEVSLVLPDSKVTPVFTWPLAANEFVQIPLGYFNVTDAIYNARVSVRVIDGTGRVTAYGSLIDNISKDPTYVPAQ